MKYIFLIGIATACFNLYAEIEGRYSLWPRRPEAFDAAHKALHVGNEDKARELLSPYLRAQGITGEEARALYSKLNLPRYLSRRNPHAKIYSVRSGDTIHRVAQSQKCPAQLILMLNGMVEPSRLRIGQKLVIAPMVFSLEYMEHERELLLWDGEELVARYLVLSQAGQLKKDEEYALSKVSLELNGRAIAQHSPYFAAANRKIHFEGGLCLSANATEEEAPCTLRLAQKDLNELAFFMARGLVLHLP